MRIGVVVTPRLIPRWTATLLERLGGDSGLVVAEPHAGPDPRGTALAALLGLERTLSGSARRWLVDDIAQTPDAAALRRLDVSRPPELLIDLGDCGVAPAGASRMLTPLFDGVAGEAGLWSALLDGRAPLISLADSSTATAVALALPAIEAPHRLLDSADAVLTHLVNALADAAGLIGSGQGARAFATTPSPSAMPPGAARSPLGFSAARVFGKAKSVLDRRLQRAPVWQVAWRAARERSAPGRPLDAAAFHRLADDGRRYYADPFVIEHAGATHLFVEELPYATGRGIISHTLIDASGRMQRPVPVLETAHHLSYPHVFAHAGEIWMLPECAASGRLDLYRADPFPHHWVRHATLIDAPVHDATLFAHAGRWWITAGVALGSASSWDTLAIYSADRIDGQWQPHPGNPVLVDARAARPAGGIFHRDGVLWRPAQDCRGGYGAALSLCRVDRLDPERFSQTLISTLHFGAPGDHTGPHTLNHGGGFEVVDFYAPRAPARQARGWISRSGAVDEKELRAHP